MGRICTYDDSHLKKAVNHPQDFPYKNRILKIFEKYGYYNEEIAFKVSKIRKWDDDAQQARYERLADIVSLIPFLSSPNECKKIANTPLGKDGVKEYLGVCAEFYMWKSLGKWQCENYRMLCSFLRDKKAFDGPGTPILQKDGSMALYSGGKLRRISKAEYDTYLAELKTGCTGKSPFSEEEWIFLMDSFIVEQNGEDYSDYDDIEPDAFKTAVERAYNYIIEHVEDIHNDEELLSRAPTFTTARLVDMILYGKLRSILGQRDVTYVQASRQISEAVDISFFFHRLPGLLEEYQEWKLLHDDKYPFGGFEEKEKGVGEGEINTSYITNVYSVLENWRGDEYSHVSNYFVAQYLYFVLTGELVAKDGKVPMPIACVIDEVMRLFGYLEDIDWEAIFNGMQDQDGNEVSANRINAEIRKKRLDCVKHFFRVDPKTKEYFRLK